MDRNLNGTLTAITLMVPMADTSYSILGAMQNTSNGWGFPGCAVKILSATQVSIGVASVDINMGSSQKVIWQVSGTADANFTGIH